MIANSHQQQISAIAMATLAFSACFAVWTLVSVIGLQIKNELGLSETEFGVLVATPILTGALLRLPMGILAERWGSRKLIVALLLFVSVPLFLFSYASSFNHYLLLGLGVGASGSMFSVGIHFVSSRSSERSQGLAMGIFGAGNLGAAITNLIAPLVIIAYGWRMAPTAYGVVLLLLAFLFWMLTDEDQQTARQPRRIYKLAEQMKPLSDARVWRFGLYYFFVFGGFISLALWLPDYYVSHYGLDIQTASFLTLMFTLPGALTRILGGWSADQLGARHVNWSVFWVCLVCLFFLSYPPTTMTVHGIREDTTFVIDMPVWLFTALVMVMGVAMGFGKASVFRLVYDYYPERMGVVGGMVGMLGAIGGFLLPILFGLMADTLGVRSSCFMLLYGVLAVCMCVMYYGISIEERRTRLQEAIRNNFLKEDSEVVND
ncbi:nitrate/nitrite transporter [Neptunomonas qingdaonensis]|uniref:MFS transporter, NNP family, nitrate/nitrite transporter n=1 Tax=Neptunomonas qingdaonensis TaxID=1045558 RepID=A0A1I2UM54_9GAMM|nr:nitrate/nitrite transporter [Neptunomonas qingdaonensis]SFG78242.1 MFS transporter, NNP family, nitrate/nitrite transporter [Neptunomonas qingdaonensis]